VDRRVSELDQESAVAAKEDPVARRLQTVPGIGPITAKALAAAVARIIYWGSASAMIATCARC